MKLFTLLALVGFAAASSHYSFSEQLEAGSSVNALKWEAGHEYVYSYSGRLLTGIPELSLHHFSGIGIKCQVKLLVRPDMQIVLKVEDAKYSRVNEKMQPATGDQKGHNWRHLEMPSFVPVPSETRMLLEKASSFKLSETSGKVVSVKVSEYEPEWSVNFKKALIALFQTGSVRPISVEAEVPLESGRRSHSAAVPLVWTSYEHSPDGECETKYDMEEIPESMAMGAEGEKLITRPEMCPKGYEGESKVYQLTKVRNLDNCIKNSIYSFYKPGYLSCKKNGSGSCGSLWTRSSITRYYVCGTPERYVIQSIINEGEINHGMMGFKSEKMLTGSRQVLKLLEKSRKESSSMSVESAGTVEHTSLMYKYTKANEERSKHVSDIDYNMIGYSRKDINKEEVMRKVEELIKEIAHTDLFTPLGLPEKEISFKVLNIAKVFKIFDRTMLEKVYDNLVRSESGERHEVVKNILVDTIAMSGTTESIKFFLHLVERNELPKSQIAAIFFNLPRYVITPTSYLLEDLFEVIKSEPVKSSRYVYTTAVLAFSNLLQKACLSHNRHSSYPTEIYGKFCHKESGILTEKWIPYLERQLTKNSDYEWKNLHIVALGHLSHDQILPVVLPIIEEDSSVEASEGRNIHMARYLAVYSLLNVGRHYPERVLPVVSSIFTNKAEPTDIRIAAFTVIMELNPDMALLQKIASMTWYEKDTEVLRTINIAFYTLANQISMQDYKPDSAHLVRRVRLIYPLIKKTGGSIPSSGIVYSNDFMGKMDLGYERKHSWIAAEDSLVPSYFYDKITFFLSEEYKYTPFEFAVHLREVFPTLYDALSGTEATPLEEVKSKLSHEWRETIEKLKIKVRDNKTPEGYFFLNIFEDSTFFHSFSQASGEEVKRVMKNPELLKEYLSGEKKFNYQRVFDLTPAEAMIPSDLGLPIIMDLNMPTVVSLRGYFRGESPMSYMKYKMSFETVVDKRLIGWVGTLCPFTGEFIITGVDEHSVLNMPFDWSLDVNMNEGSIRSSLKMASSSGSASGPYDILYYRVVPFTVHQKFFTMKPIFKSENFKVIKSTTPEKEREFSIGDYFGLDMKAIYKSETPYCGLRYALEKMSNFNYNPLNFLRFPNAGSLALTHSGKPSFRKHELKVVYSPERSSTKEIEYVLKFGVATKEKGQPAKYHKLEVEPSSRKPFKVVSKPIGEHSSQARRQEKVKEIFEKLQIDAEGRAFTVLLTTTFKGSRSSSYTYSATFGTGQTGIKQKWDLKLKSESSSRAVCVRGDISIPTYSIWKLREILSEDPVFHYHNTIGYGTECESKIVMTGYAKTSEKQKKLSMETPESKEYKRLLAKRTPMIKMSKLAELVRRQASAIDEYNYKIEYVRVGKEVILATKDALEILQVYWLPYYRTSSSLSAEEVMPALTIPISREALHGLESTLAIDVRTRVHPSRKTLDVEISSTSGEDKYLYRDIPLPYPFQYMYPVSYVHDPVSSATKALTGKPLYPICTLEGRYISTFDNRTYKGDVDSCYHLMSGDCSKSLQYGVLVRSLESQPEKKEIKVLLKEATVTLKPEGSRGVIVEVNGRTIEVPKTEKKPIKNEEGKIVAYVIKSKDEVVILKSSKITVYFDGKKIKLEGSNLLKNKLCGLCGDNNNKKVNDLLSPRKCILSKPELVVASYRVGSLGSKQCRPLPESIKVQLEKQEHERCVKPVHQHTKVSQAYAAYYSYGASSAASGSECARPHHEIVDKYASHEYCFSRIPILECGYKCHPVGVREKSVSFTCMRKDRRGEHIAEKIRNGEVLPELKNLPVSFSTTRSIPVECKPYSRH